VIDDARVSRSHAQLRLRFGHYVVYDLGSSGGTFVNGQRIEECVLRPGDVISLGGVPVIYGEDAPYGPEIHSPHSTRPLVPPSTG
jgi:pSer/pThr/pTyr-binding forkhead associated (FHA) protein